MSGGCRKVSALLQIFRMVVLFFKDERLNRSWLKRTHSLCGEGGEERSKVSSRFLHTTVLP